MVSYHPDAALAQLVARINNQRRAHRLPLIKRNFRGDMIFSMEIVFPLLNDSSPRRVLFWLCLAARARLHRTAAWSTPLLQLRVEVC